jgi:hypothetical protein
VQLESREGVEEIVFYCRNLKAAHASGNVPTTRQKGPRNERRREMETSSLDNKKRGRSSHSPFNSGASSPAHEIVSSAAAEQAEEGSETKEVDEGMKPV